MFEAGSIFVTMGINMTPLAAGLRAGVQLARQAGMQAGDAFSSGFSRGGAFARIQEGINRFSMLKFQARELYGIFKDITGIGIAGEFGREETAFNALTGDPNRAKAIVRDLSQYAAKTMFDTGGILTLGRRLLAAGVPVEELPETVRFAADVGSAMGWNQTGFRQFLNAYTDIQAGGFTGNNPMQVQNLGINIAQLARRAGAGADVDTKAEALSWFRQFEPEEQARLFRKGMGHLAGFAEQQGTGTLAGVEQNVPEQLRLIQLETGRLLLPSLLAMGRGIIWLSGVFAGLNDATRGWAGLAALGAAAAGAWVMMNGSALLAIGSINRLTASIAALTLTSNLGSGAPARNTLMQLLATGAGSAAGAGGGGFLANAGRWLKGGLWGALIGGAVWASWEWAKDGTDWMKNNPTLRAWDAKRGFGSASPEAKAAEEARRNTEALKANTDALKTDVGTIGGGRVMRQGSTTLEYALARSAMTGIV